MRSKENFSINNQTKGDVTIISLKGALVEEAGVALASEVSKKLSEGCKRFIFDFGYSLMISSPTVATVLDLAEQIVDVNGGKLILSSLTELNLKVFEMVGIFLYAEACSTLQEAEIKVLL